MHADVHTSTPGDGCHVRGDYHIGHLPQRMGFREGFRGEDVQNGSAQPPGGGVTERVGQSWKDRADREDKHFWV